MYHNKGNNVLLPFYSFFISGGVYKLEIPSGGVTPKEFENIDNHPFVVLKSAFEEDLYYCIQTTSNTEERWNELENRGHAGVKLDSIRSIAKLNKFIIVRESVIKQRYFSKNINQVAVITPKEFNDLSVGLSNYIKTNFDNQCHSYKQFYRQLNKLKDCVSNDNIYKLKFKENEKQISFKFSYYDFQFLTLYDFLCIFDEYFQKPNIYFRRKSNSIFVNIDKNDTKYLTFRKKYDSINIEGNSDSTSDDPDLRVSLVT